MREQLFLNVVVGILCITHDESIITRFLHSLFIESIMMLIFNTHLNLINIGIIFMITVNESLLFVYVILIIIECVYGILTKKSKQLLEKSCIVQSNSIMVFSIIFQLHAEIDLINIRLMDSMYIITLSFFLINERTNEEEDNGFGILFGTIYMICYLLLICDVHFKKLNIDSMLIFVGIMNILGYYLLTIKLILAKFCMNVKFVEGNNEECIICYDEMETKIKFECNHECCETCYNRLKEERMNNCFFCRRRII